MTATVTNCCCSGANEVRLEFWMDNPSPEALQSIYSLIETLVFSLPAFEPQDPAAKDFVFSFWLNCPLWPMGPTAWKEHHIMRVRLALPQEKLESILQERGWLKPQNTKQEQSA